MQLIVERFRADCRKVLGDDDAGLLLAVSGGPDSMALLTLAHAAFADRIAVATVDHRLRSESAGEAAMVAAQCAALGVRHATLAPDAPIAGASLQAQARGVRYALLAAHARSIDAAAVLTAHHADDQAETLLMRAARGSGLAGLAGVRARTAIAGADVVRPLLDWRRAELRAIVRRAEVPFVDDPANQDSRHDRTRFRRLLEANEWLDTPNLARAAAALADADRDMRAMVDWVWRARARTADGEVRIDVADLPRELLRRVARRAIDTVLAREAGDAANIEKLLDALAAGRRATQAGVIGSVRGTIWRFRPAPPRRSAA